MIATRRAVPLVAVFGFGAALLVAAVTGRAYTGTSTPPTDWWGLVGSGYLPGRTVVWGVLLWVGITGLSLAWLSALWLVRGGALDVRRGWWLVAAWTAPLALGPPAVSKDVYAYAAQGLVQHHGGDIYRDGPDYLAGVPGAMRALTAVDPKWRDDPSPYGPVASLVQWFAGSFGSPVAALVVLRIVAVLSVVALVWLCMALAASDRRALVLVLVGLNPLVLIHLVSGAHLEALMCAVLVASLVAARRGVWWLAIVLAVVAGLVKAPALLAVPVVIGWHVLSSGRRRVLPDVALAAVALAVVPLLVPDGWGWVRKLSTPAGGMPTLSVSGHLASLANHIDPVAKSAVTVLAALVAVGVMVAMALTFRRRPPNESLGWALLAGAFVLPVVYPWYALWGLVCLLPTLRGRGLLFLMGLSVAVAGYSIPGGPGTVLEPLVLVVLVGSVAGVVVGWRRSDDQVVASVGS